MPKGAARYNFALKDEPERLQQFRKQSARSGPAMKFLKSLSVLSSFVLLGCSSVNLAAPGQPEGAPPEAPARQLAGDMPLPPGATIRAQETLVMGTGTRWIGRINLAVAGEPQNAFTFFRDGLPAAGWALTSSSFSRFSVLTFTKGDRVATVQIQAASFGGNEVNITVTPAVTPAAMPGARATGATP